MFEIYFIFKLETDSQNLHGMLRKDLKKKWKISKTTFKRFKEERFKKFLRFLTFYSEPASFPSASPVGAPSEIIDSLTHKYNVVCCVID